MRTLIARIEECFHWAHEEPYDAERRRHIARAVARLRCDHLAADIDRAERRFHDRPEVLAAIRAAVAATE